MLIFAYFFFFKQKTIPKSNDDIEKKEEIQQALQKEAEVIAENITLKELAPKKIKGWKLKSKLARFFKNKNEILCNDITFKLITENNKVATLISGTTKIDVETKDVFLEGDVHGKFIDFKLHGKDLVYEFDKHLLKSEKEFSLNHPQINITSQNTQLDLKTKTIFLAGGIKSVFTTNLVPKT